MRKLNSRLNRAERYAKSNMSLRLALAHVANAIKEVGVAEVLHTSRQAPHLDAAMAQLEEAVRCFRDTQRSLLPMRAFKPTPRRTR